MQRSTTISNTGKSVIDAIIWCLRHCRSGWSPADIPKGYLDWGLDDSGKLQAEEVACFIQVRVPNEDGTRMVCSPHLRAAETAEAISKKTGIIIADKIDGLKARYYGDCLKFPIDPATGLPTDAETGEQFINRADKTLRQILEENEHTKNLIIVTHNEIFRHLAKMLTGEENKRLMEGGVSCCFIKTNGEWTIEILEIIHFDVDKKKAAKKTAILKQWGFFQDDNFQPSSPKPTLKRSLSSRW